MNAKCCLEKRGKFKNTCFRVDLDLSQQMSSVLDTLEEGYAMEDALEKKALLAMMLAVTKCWLVLAVAQRMRVTPRPPTWRRPLPSRS